MKEFDKEKGIKNRTISMGCVLRVCMCVHIGFDGMKI